MNSQRKIRAGLSVLLIGLMLGASAGLAARPKDPEKRLARMKKHLGLSAEQVTKIRAIHQKYAPQMKALREKSKAGRKGLHEMLIKDNASRDDVKAKLQEMANLKVEKRLIWFDQHREVREVLTPAQREKLRKHMEARHKKGKGKHKGKRGRHHCD